MNWKKAFAEFEIPIEKPIIREYQLPDDIKAGAMAYKKKVDNEACFRGANWGSEWVREKWLSGTWEPPVLRVPVLTDLQRKMMEEKLSGIYEKIKHPGYNWPPPENFNQTASAINVIREAAERREHYRTMELNQLREEKRSFWKRVADHDYDNTPFPVHIQSRKDLAIYPRQKVECLQSENALLKSHRIQLGEENSALRNKLCIATKFEPLVLQKLEGYEQENTTLRDNLFIARDKVKTLESQLEIEKDVARRYGATFSEQSKQLVSQANEIDRLRKKIDDLINFRHSVEDRKGNEIL